MTSGTKMLDYCGRGRIIEKPAQDPDADVLGNVVTHNGFTISAAQIEELLKALADHSFNAATFNHPRRSHETRKWCLPKGCTIERLGKVALRGRNCVYPDTEAVCGVSHSMGGPAMLKAAINNPDAYESLIVTEPLGASGKHSFGELVKGAAKSVVNDISYLYKDREGGLYHPGLDDDRAVGLAGLKHIRSLGYVAKNFPLALCEALTARDWNILNDIETVLELGIPVTVILAHSDELFSHERTEAFSEKLLELEGPITVLSVADKNAGHNYTWTHPNSTAELIRQINETQNNAY